MDEKEKGSVDKRGFEWGVSIIKKKILKSCSNRESILNKIKRNTHQS